MSYVVAACQAVVAVCLLVAARSKLTGRAAFAEFAGSLVALRLAARGSARVTALAVAVVVAELAVAVAVLLPWSATVGLGLATLLLGGFTAVVLRAVLADVREPCRCFGATTRPLAWSHVARNLALAAVAGAGAAGAVSGPTPGDPGATALAWGAGLLAGALVSQLDLVLDLFTPPAARPVRRPSVR